MTVTRLGRRRLVATVASMTAGAAVAACSTSNGSSEQAVDRAAAQPGPVDVGFFRDMSLHHAQALALSQRVLATDTGGPVQAAAAEILQNQAYEVGMMHAWLRSWGESTAPPENVMGWMHTPLPAELMPGLASTEQMRELAELDGTDKGRLFLELMIEHHRGGVHMAETAERNAETEVVRGAARQMALAQRFEISTMEHLLEADYRPS